MSTIKVNKIENTATADGGINIDSSGNIGFSTSSPNEVFDSRGAAVFSGDHATSQNAYGTAHGIMLSSTSNLASIKAVSNGSNDVAIRFIPLSSGSGSEAMRILAGGGLTFNGDTAAANALEDYEEGTWTPTISGNTLDLSGGHSEYTKIGNRVFFQTHFNVGSNPGDTFDIGGLPFTSSSTSRSAISIVINDASSSFTQVAGQTATVGSSGTTVACDMHGTITLASEDRINLGGSYIV